MSDLVTAIVVMGLIAVAMVALVWLAARARRRGTAGSAIAGAMAAYDEGMHGTAHDAFMEIQEQEQRVEPGLAKPCGQA